VSDENRVAVLRKEIQQAAHLITFWRRFAPMALVGAPINQLISHILRDDWSISHLLDACLFAGSIIWATAVALPALRRRLALHHLSDKLAALTPLQRSEVLLDLQDEQGETRACPTKASSIG
jgi:hypothetical protein